MLRCPLNFQQLLEAWVLIECKTCRRGSDDGTKNDLTSWMPSKTGKDETNMHMIRAAQKTAQMHGQSSYSKLRRVLEAWMNPFCCDCGRGNFKTMGDFQPNDGSNKKLLSSLTSSALPVTPRILYELVKSWVSSFCPCCKRGGQTSMSFASKDCIATQEIITEPISFALVAKAWTGEHCSNCKLGACTYENSGFEQLHHVSSFQPVDMFASPSPPLSPPPLPPPLLKTTSSAPSIADVLSVPMNHLEQHLQHLLEQYLKSSSPEQLIAINPSIKQTNPTPLVAAYQSRKRRFED